MNHPEREIVEKKVRRAMMINALCKISAIVDREQQADTEKANALRWLARYGWIVLPGVALVVAYLMGLI